MQLPAPVIRAQGRESNSDCHFAQCQLNGIVVSSI